MTASYVTITVVWTIFTILIAALVYMLTSQRGKAWINSRWINRD